MLNSVLTNVPAFVAVGLWIVFQIVQGYFAGAGGGVAYAAHIGGFVGGLVLIKIFAIGTGNR
jgi:membrane associated rhomboid family serine protease